VGPAVPAAENGPSAACAPSCRGRALSAGPSCIFRCRCDSAALASATRLSWTETQCSSQPQPWHTGRWRPGQRPSSRCRDPGAPNSRGGGRSFLTLRMGCERRTFRRGTWPARTPSQGRRAPWASTWWPNARSSYSNTWLNRPRLIRFSGWNGRKCRAHFMISLMKSAGLIRFAGLTGPIWRGQWWRV
jgi:hypothetical protein